MYDCAIIGVLIRGASVVENMGAITTVALDKTGTLTKGYDDDDDVDLDDDSGDGCDIDGDDDDNIVWYGADGDGAIAMFLLTLLSYHITTTIRFFTVTGKVVLSDDEQDGMASLAYAAGT